LDKWTRLRIALVGLGFGIIFVAIIFRFIYLQITKNVGYLLLILSIIVFLVIILLYEFSKDINLRSKNIYNSVDSLDKYIIEQSIDELISNNKLKKSAVIYFIMFISYIIYMFIHLYYPAESFLLVTAFIMLVMLLLFINNSILEYRINKGYYGSTDYEAREIINFILTLPSNTDFRNGAAFKNLFQVNDDRTGDLIGESIDKIKECSD
jgi:hypothetical protein